MEIKKINILLVDEDPDIRRMTGGLLAKNGFEVMYASNGNEGRETARRMQPDLILMDYIMPIMDGVEAISRLKSDDITKNIPIILLTNIDLSIEAETGMKEIGMDDYISKSVEFDVLLEHIQRLLKSKEQK